VLYRTRPCPELAHVWEQRACAKLDEVVSQTLATEQRPTAVRPVTVRAESLADAVTATATAPTDEIFAPAARPGLLTRLGFYHRTPGRGVALAR
jgi:hypothetical protein